MICLKCKAEDSMKDLVSGSWENREVCSKCGTSKHTYFQDMMSGCMISKTEEWIDADNNVFQKIDYDREGNVIKPKKKEPAEQMKKYTIEIPITENDIEDFKDLVYRGKDFDWVFDSEDGLATVTVQFVGEEDEDDE